METTVMQKVESFSVVFRYVTPIMLSFMTWILNDIKDDFGEMKKQLNQMEIKYDSRFVESSRVHSTMAERIKANEVRWERYEADRKQMTNYK